MYDAILVPTDGSDGAAAAAGHAVALARAFDASVHAVYVADVRMSPISTAMDRDTVLEMLDRADERPTDAVVERAEAAGLTATGEIRVGVPDEEIRAAAAETDADLVAMGTHGRTGLDRLLLGSVAERVVRTSEVPVFTCHADSTTDDGYEGILVPTDGSEYAAAAAEHALAVAERFEATVHALSVVDVGAFAGAYDAGASVPTVIDVLEDNAERAVATVADRCRDRGLDVETQVVEGMPFRAIRDRAREADVDMVAMGTHGRTGLSHVLLGSVAERTVRTAEVPVLTVRGARED